MLNIKKPARLFAACLCHVFAASNVAVAQTGAPSPALKAAFERLEAQLPLRAADHTALKTAAKARTVDTLRVCGDPGNMPLSDINRAGFQNKIIELVAQEIGAKVNYFWRPYLMRGITRQTFDTNDCDILLDMPADFEQIITTEPVYRTTYVFAYRSDRDLNIKSLEDPILRKLKIGVFQTSGLRMALTRRGVIENVSLHVISHNADLKPENQPWRQVQKVIDGELDVAGVWGPFAGWLKAQGKPLTLQPTNLWEERIPQEFDLAIGLRNVDWVLKYKLDLALDAKRHEIEQILRSFGVPLVQCSKCVVPGDLPAHGIYTKPLYAGEAEPPAGAKAEDQIVTRDRVEDWLADGADINQELSNAVLAVDIKRIEFLVERGADLNAIDRQGYAPLHTAARNREPELLKRLVKIGANVNLTDRDGMAAIHHATMRNHPESIAALAAAGADLDIRNSSDFTPLAMALLEDQYRSAAQLIESGASVNTRVGELKLTPLMIASGKEKRQLTLGAGIARVQKLDPRDPDPIDIVRALLAKDAEINAQSSNGTTALMLAAAHDNAPIVGLLVQAGADGKIKNAEGKSASDLARQNENNAVVSLFKLLDQAQGN